MSKNLTDALLKAVAALEWIRSVTHDAPIEYFIKRNLKEIYDLMEEETGEK